MSGRLLQSFKCETENQKAYALRIINEKKDLYIVEVNISCPEDKKNAFFNFPPSMMNIGITN
jgi:dihydroorotate dehydrogenase